MKVRVLKHIFRDKLDPKGTIETPEGRVNREEYFPGAVVDLTWHDAPDLVLQGAVETVIEPSAELPEKSAKRGKDGA